MKIQNKTILVTDGGSGMGRELVLALLKRGALAVALDINDETLKESTSLKPMKPDKAAQMIIEGIEKDRYRSFDWQRCKNHGLFNPIISKVCC